jgi:mediator of RNA polymerase II transcription subunit 14
MRLNLYEYDSIPLQFRDFTIKSGRVTFKVPGEFELDLTVADEDQAAQFWFLDLRFQFRPSPTDLAPGLRPFIENKVNEALFKDGLPGCYKFLHEMVLTHKISEFRKQAIALSRGKWIETLKVEPLQRALAIQYWVDRYNKGPKSWIILAVHSGKRAGMMNDSKANSHLMLRWFRDGKEMQDVDICFDEVNISAESLLKAVIAKHINYILTSTFEKLQEKPLYASHELSLSLSISDSDPADTNLSVQATRKHQISVRMHPVNGRFVLGPPSRAIFDAEYRLNNGTHDPANDAHNYLEYLRYTLISDDLVGHATTVGWLSTNNPGLKMDELKKVMSKDNLRILWLRRAGWVKDWYMAVGLSMHGERWVLLQTYVNKAIFLSKSSRD